MAQNERPNEIDLQEERRERRLKAKQFRKRALLVLSLVTVVLALLIVLVLVLLLRARIGADTYAAPAEEETAALSIEYVGEKTVTAERETIVEPTPEPEKPVPVITTEELISVNAYMIRPEDQKVLFDEAGDTHIYPASMTKMMTAILAIENLDMSAPHTIVSNEVDQAYMSDATMAGFAVGETVPMEDLLYGVLLPSGAECCYALASEVVGQEWDYEAPFAEMMNEKAKEIGMTNTHFSNCTGLQSEDHWSTCQDMAKLLEYGLKNELFRKVISAHTYTTSSTPYHENGINLMSTLFASTGNSILENGTSIMGGKTGYTDEAGHCLASYASTENETEYILVTAGAYSDVYDYTNIADAKYIYGQLPEE